MLWRGSGEISGKFWREMGEEKGGLDGSHMDVDFLNCRVVELEGIPGSWIFWSCYDIGKNVSARYSWITSQPRTVQCWFSCPFTAGTSVTKELQCVSYHTGVSLSLTLFQLPPYNSSSPAWLFPKKTVELSTKTFSRVRRNWPSFKTS